MTQIVASIDDPSAGPSYSATRLTAELAAQGINVALRTVDGWRGQRAGNSALVNSAPYVIKSPLGAGPINRLVCGSSALYQGLQEDAGLADVFHSHGLWLMPNVYPSWAARRKSGAPVAVMVSPRGMLGAAALQFSYRRKKAFWALLQKRAVSAAAVLHATSEAEWRDIREFGLENPVAIIPNGIDLPDLRASSQVRQRELLYLGRVHPKKGIDMLIRAWALAAPTRPDWRVRIVGPAEGGYDQSLRQIVSELGVPRIAIEGASYGPERLEAYQRASIFVLPTLNENFAMVVAEALAAELPVISSKGAPWSGLVKERCGWWVDSNVVALATAIEEATATPAVSLAEMGQRGRAWMARDYGWPRVAREMIRVYTWMKNGGPRPPMIRFD